MEDLKAYLRPTLVLESRKLSQFVGLNLLIASETFQHTGSFKYRAAYNVVLNSKSNHLITISSGNFGQALACACQQFEKRCTILMPETSARVKIEAVRGYGANVKLVDTEKRSRAEHLSEFVSSLAESHEVVSPYDDDRVIDGNSSLADDLLEHKEQFDAVLVPVGGGGLASGLVKGLKRNNLDATVYGVEPVLANDAARSLRSGKLESNEFEFMSIADGVRTLSLGKRNWEILKTGLEDVLEVREREIEAAVGHYYSLANLKVEPSGALSLAALIAHKEKFENKKPLLIVSGGNVDPAVYASLIKG